MAAKGGLETHLLQHSAHNCGLKVTVATKKKGSGVSWEGGLAAFASLVSIQS